MLYLLRRMLLEHFLLPLRLHLLLIVNMLWLRWKLSFSLAPPLLEDILHMLTFCCKLPVFGMFDGFASLRSRVIRHFTPICHYLDCGLSWAMHVLTTLSKKLWEISRSLWDLVRKVSDDILAWNTSEKIWLRRVCRFHLAVVRRRFDLAKLPENMDRHQAQNLCPDSGHLMPPKLLGHEAYDFLTRFDVAAYKPFGNVAELPIPEPEVLKVFLQGALPCANCVKRCDGHQRFLLITSVKCHVGWTLCQFLRGYWVFFPCWSTRHGFKRHLCWLWFWWSQIVPLVAEITCQPVGVFADIFWCATYAYWCSMVSFLCFQQGHLLETFTMECARGGHSLQTCYDSSTWNHGVFETLAKTATYWCCF